MIVGYARVSSSGQSLDVQLDALADAGCEKVFAEKKSGTSRDAREQLRQALEFVRQGDTLVVTRLDRLARSVSDLHQIVDQLSAKGVAFKCLNQSAVDTDTSTGRLMLAMLAAVAAFEADIRRERQAEGIEKAIKAGKKFGRPSSVNVDQIVALHGEGLSPTQIANRLGIGRTSVWRALKGRV